MPASKGIGIWKTTKARNAEEAIGHTEGLLTVLRMTQVDLKPAEEAVRIAKEFFSTQAYTKALAAAQQAERLAITLDERHSRFEEARKSLESLVADLKDLGLPTDAYRGALRRADEKVLSGLWENGSLIPNYMEGRVLLTRAQEQARDVHDRALAASNAIFLAEIAIESLSDIGGPSNQERFAEGATLGLQESLEEATRQLALGELDSALRIAKSLSDRATHLRADFLEAMQLVQESERLLSTMRGEGIPTHRLESEVALTRDVLARGMIDSGFTIARRLAKQAQSLRDGHDRATRGLHAAEIAYAKMNLEGFHSGEVELAIRETRKSILEGQFEQALEHLERVLVAISKPRDAKDALAKAIEGTRQRVTALKGRGLPFMSEVEELLGRAEREFREGNYSGSGEDLRVATVLLGSSNAEGGP